MQLGPLVEVCQIKLEYVGLVEVKETQRSTACAPAQPPTSNSRPPHTTLLYLLNWESELLTKSFDCGKLGSAAVCGGAEGRSKAVVAVVLGKEQPLAGRAGGEVSVLEAGIDGVAEISWEKQFRGGACCTAQPSWLGRCMCKMAHA